MQTVNGKLTVEPPELDGLKLNIRDLTQQFEHLELQMTAMSERDKIDHLKQIASVQLSLQKLERTYSRLIFTIILTAIALASWYIRQDFNHHPSLAKQPHPKTAITSTKSTAKR